MADAHAVATCRGTWCAAWWALALSACGSGAATSPRQTPPSGDELAQSSEPEPTQHESAPGDTSAHDPAPGDTAAHDEHSSSTPEDAAPGSDPTPEPTPQTAAVTEPAPESPPESTSSAAPTPPGRRACTPQTWGGWAGTPACRRAARRTIPAAHQRCENDGDCALVGTGCDPHGVSARVARRYERWPPPCSSPGGGACSSPMGAVCIQGCCAADNGIGGLRGRPGRAPR